MVKAFAARLRRIADRLDPPKPVAAQPMGGLYCASCQEWFHGTGHIHISAGTPKPWRFTNTTI